MAKKPLEKGTGFFEECVIARSGGRRLTAELEASWIKTGKR